MIKQNIQEVTNLQKIRSTQNRNSLTPETISQSIRLPTQYNNPKEEKNKKKKVERNSTTSRKRASRKRLQHPR